MTLTAGGGSLKIFKVADRTNGTGIAATADFAGAGLPESMDDVASDAVNWAAKLLTYAEDNSVSATAVKSVDSSGNVSFETEAGLYLVATEEAPKGYCDITPFLIDLPHFEDGQWDYNPAAGPKMSAAARIDPPIEKIVNPTWAGKNETFTFTMTPGNKSWPMPDPAEYTDGTASINTSTGAMTITKKGPGSTEFGWMYFTETGTYTYTLAEKAGSTKGWTYDTTSYTMTVVVSKNEKGEMIPEVTTTDSKGNAVTKMSFTNKYEEPEKKVPQTGQLWWPVAVMGLGGAALIAVGAGLRKKRKESDR